MFTIDISPESQTVIDRCLNAYSEATPYRYKDKKKYIATLNAFYKEEGARRFHNLKKVKDDLDAQKAILMHVSRRENIVDFMVDWCWTHDPRNANVGLPTIIPFIPFPRQIEFIEWFYELYLNQDRGIVEKSRDQGVTWLFCLVELFEWRWVQGFTGGFGSNKLDNVDKRDEPDAIFHKLRGLLKTLPKWWKPIGFDLRKHDKKGNLVNPQMNANISGQGGRNIGRGGRKSMYLVDEAASLEYPKDADESLSQTTECQIDLSTPKGMNHFGLKRHSGKLPVFTFNWRDDPRKNEEWYAKQKEMFDPVLVAQEIDIDYQASVEGIFIKKEWVEAAIDIQLGIAGTRSAGLDVAAGGSNDSALAIKLGPTVTVEAYNIPNGIDLTHDTIDVCNRVGIDYLNYDKIGVGYAVVSTLERTERKMDFKYYGLEAGDSPSDDMYPEFGGTGKKIFFNARSEWWYKTARLFQNTYEHQQKIREYKDDEMISIENDGQLLAELCGPKKMHTDTGKIKCESKQFMLKRGVKSPDRADALVLAVQKKAGGKKHVMDEINFNDESEVNIDWELPIHRTRHYGALVLNPDLSVHFLCAVWDEEGAVLSIYDEYSSRNPNPLDIAEEIVAKMKLKQYHIDKIIGNKPIFEDSKKTVQKEINRQFKRLCGSFQNIKIREARRYDKLGSASALMNLLKSKSIRIDSKCREIKQQFISWKIDNEKFESDGMREGLLLIISELMLFTPFKIIIAKKEPYSNVIPSPLEPMRPVSGPMEV